jgi:hypothetical protein
LVKLLTTKPGRGIKRTKDSLCSSRPSRAGVVLTSSSRAVASMRRNSPDCSRRK